MIVLTIDTDWAPEEAVRAVMEKIQTLGIKTTIFFSTPCPLPPWPLLETGCHPDLSRRCPAAPEPITKDGLEMATLAQDAAVDQAEKAILQNYRAAFPQAMALRTHRFYWHSDLSRNLVQNGFFHDSSMILPYHPNLKGFRVGRLTRWPVWASDHLHLARRLPLGRLEMPHFHDPGLKIFCFHVAYLHLNVASLDDFNMIKTRLGDSTANPATLKGQAPGIWNLFEMLAEKIYRHSSGYWLSELPGEFIV